MTRATLFVLLLAAAGVSPAWALDPEIRASVKLPAGAHRLTKPLTVLADDVVVDLGDAVLLGAEADTPPDRLEGIGLVVEGREKVTIRGGTLRGFRCAILVKDCAEVVIEGVEVADNFRQRLGSTPEREDAGDWLWPHENDQQEWRKKYGAGICLENCRKSTVRECRGRRQQNGIILDRCEDCRVYDNDMSFLSGWGLALWRSSGNVVSHNSFDWCVRGYSHGVYDRGQDSAGILVFEQCSRNVFYKNSATHGGDGFFLYAGNETVKQTGQGGCNDNFVLNNDFSHAVANAIEATFSRGNLFRGNRCDDSNYGIWAGYSYDSDFEGNVLRDNTIAGVAIEHGSGNRIHFNTFTNNPRGIWLWWDDDKDLLASAFGKRTGGRSAKYAIAMNSFLDDKVAVFLRDTAEVRLKDNHLEGVGKDVVREGECPDVVVDGEWTEPVQGTKVEGTYPGERDAFLPADHPRGRAQIRVGEWGPLDPKAVEVFPRRVIGWGGCTFHVVGPGDAAVAVEGLPDGLEGRVTGRSVRVEPGGGGADGLRAFRGTVVVGEARFPIEGVVLRATWRIRYWKWTEDPREEGAWERLVATDPVREVTAGGLDFAWRNGGPGDGVPADRFATVATARLALPAGRYRVRTVSDDGIRVRVDGKVVQEDWTHHGPTEHATEVDLAEGEHEFSVEHFEIDGWAMLRLALEPR